jgi:hypothetical protein
VHADNNISSDDILSRISFLLVAFIYAGTYNRGEVAEWLLLSSFCINNDMQIWLYILEDISLFYSTYNRGEVAEWLLLSSFRINNDMQIWLYILEDISLFYSRLVYSRGIYIY